MPALPGDVCSRPIECGEREREREKERTHTHTHNRNYRNLDIPEPLPHFAPPAPVSFTFSGPEVTEELLGRTGAKVCQSCPPSKSLTRM